MMNASQTNTIVMKMHSASILLEAITVFASQVILEMALYAKVRRYQDKKKGMAFISFMILSLFCLCAWKLPFICCGPKSNDTKQYHLIDPTYP